MGKLIVRLTDSGTMDRVPKTRVSLVMKEAKGEQSLMIGMMNLQAAERFVVEPLVALGLEVVRETGADSPYPPVEYELTTNEQLRVRVLDLEQTVLEMADRIHGLVEIVARRAEKPSPQE